MYVKCFENKKGILINALIFSSINEAFFFFFWACTVWENVYQIHDTDSYEKTKVMLWSSPY